ncbi:InlB B-repeat-containing protein [Clostridium sp. BSD9I1]|uniref:InlB B-repeat-containing protein n=1 Tax=Clostridium sp. BSD9I1 TaxID=2003589 RepID=UPI0016474957|nr:InlB B-repeat-containing protein [Clostridium sp. BSD9I1]
MKKRLNRRLLLNGKRSLIFLLVFMLIMQITTVKALANPGYHFTGLSDGVDTTTRIDSNVTQNISVGATFAADMKTDTPVITLTPREGDTSLVGTAVPGATVVLSVNGVAKPPVTVKISGYWTVDSLELKEGDTISVTAILAPNTVSDETTATVGEARTKLATVTGLAWDGNIARWATVPNAGSYFVQLYKNGSKLGLPAMLLPFQVANGFDFTSDITGIDGGKGTYTYKVTALADIDSLFSSADESAASNDNIVATPLAQVKNVALSPSGVVTWDPVPNASKYQLELFWNGTSKGTTPMASGGSVILQMRSGGPGVYTVKVRAQVEGEGSIYSDGPQSEASGSQTIIQLAKVDAGLKWTGNVAHWTSVPNAASYDVQLYKNENRLNGAVNVPAASAASGVDFTSAIIGVGGGAGIYTYKVTAKGDRVLLLDAAQSAVSNDNLVTSPLAQVKNVALSASGVATWDKVANASGYEVQLYKGSIEQGKAVTKSADAIDATSHNCLSDMKAAGAGVYTVKVTAKGNGTTYTNGPQSTASGSQTIKKLETVTGITWTGDVAHWTAVPNVAYYEVQLYNNGIKLYGVVTVLPGNVASGVDYSSTIAVSNAGTYTYKVKAKAYLSSLFSDSDESSASNDNIRTIQLAQVKNVALSSSGIISWNAVPNTSSYEVELFRDGTSEGTDTMESGSSIILQMRSGGPGVYTIKVTAKGNGSTYLDGPQSTASGSQNITKLETVTGLTWTGDVAHWTAVANAALYDVQLYKNGKLLNGAVNVPAASAASGVDFTSAITGVGGGAGIYTYKVTAKSYSTSLFLDAYLSASSNGNIKSPAVVTVDGSSVAEAIAGNATITGLDASKTYTVQIISGSDNGKYVNATGTVGNITPVSVTGVTDITGLENGTTYRVVDITAPALAIETTNPPAGTVGVAYSGFNFNSTGGVGIKSYTVTPGRLPAGLSLAADGTLTGTPTSAGAFSFTVSVTDSAVPPATDRHIYTMTINAAETYTVSFDSQSGSPVSDIVNINSGDKITEPSAPIRTNYTFGGWYKEASCTNAWDFRQIQ